MSDVTAGYGRFSDLIANFFKHLQIAMLRHKCRDEKYTFVIIHGYVSLVFLC